MGKLLIMLFSGIFVVAVSCIYALFQPEPEFEYRTEYSVRVNYLDGSVDTLTTSSYPYLINKRRTLPALYSGHSTVATNVRSFKVFGRINFKVKSGDND